MTEERSPDTPGPGPSDGTVSRENLRESAISGARITLGVRMVAEVAALGAMVLLTRLIPPAEVGAAAVAITFLMLSVILTFEGFGSPLVQRKVVTEAHRRTAQTVAVGAGLLLGVLIVVFALTAGRALFGDRSATLLMLTAPVYVIAGFSVVSRAMLLRELDFRRQSTYEVLGTIGQVVVAATLAFSGVDGEALVIGPAVGTALETVLLMRASRPPRPGFDRQAFRDIAEFGALTSLSGLIGALRKNMAYLVLSGLLPAREVGYYFRAFQLGAEYQGKLSVVMLRLGFPLFSRSPDRETTNRLRARIVSTNAMATAPFLALLAVLSPVLIPALFGDQWAPAAEPAQILAVAGLAQAVMSGAEPLAVASGRPRVVLGFNVLVIAAYVVVLVALSPLGLVPICVGVSVMHVVMMLLSHRILVQPQTDATVFDLLRDIAAPTVASAVAFGVGIGVGTAGGDELGTIPWLALGTLLTFGTYALVLRIVFTPAWEQALRTVGLVFGRRKRATPATAAESPAAG